MKHKNQEAQRLEADYLSRLRNALTGIPERDVEEIIQEVHRHIEDAISELPDEEVTLSKMAGILEILGPPESFADKNSTENTSPVRPVYNGKKELPVFKTLYNTIITLVDNLPVLFKALLLPSIIIFFLSIFGSLMANSISPTPNEVNGATLLVIAFIYLIYLPICGVMYTIMSVTCHRIILLGKDALPNASGIYFSMRELKYFGWGILFTVPYFICVILSALFFGIIFTLLNKIVSPESISFIMDALTIVIIPLVTLFTAPFVLVLPATAVEDERPFSRAMEVVRGNVVRLAAVLVIIPLISSIFYFGLKLVGGDVNNIAFVILNSVIVPVYVVFGIGVLSVSYKTLTYER